MVHTNVWPVEFPDFLLLWTVTYAKLMVVKRTIVSLKSSLFLQPAWLQNVKGVPLLCMEKRKLTYTHFYTTESNRASNLNFLTLSFFIRCFLIFRVNILFWYLNFTHLSKSTAPIILELISKQYSRKNEKYSQILQFNLTKSSKNFMYYPCKVLNLATFLQCIGTLN